MHPLNYVKPNILCYRIAQGASWLVSRLIFRRQLLRNEIKGKRGPFVVIANHGAALDFVNLIGATKQPMTFVISNSFYHTLPITGFLKKMGVLPKQQFQTTADDLKRMKAVINAGQPLVIYPAGLMCEDGLSTPIPTATYKFLKWLDVDVYVARTQGSYFVMPKWAKGLRPGRTTMEIYQLFTRVDLRQASLDQVKEKTDSAIIFDAYREQEQLQVSYRKGDQLAGLENVLYRCPECGKEFAMTVSGGILRCESCGLAHSADKFGFLHKVSPEGTEIRYISDWSRKIYSALKQSVSLGEVSGITAATRFQMIDFKKHKFADVGAGTVTLAGDVFTLDGTLNGAPVHIAVPVTGVPTLPFSPGRHFEVQHGKTIYRCALDDGKLVMKFINLVKIQFELSREKLATRA